MKLLVINNTKGTFPLTGGVPNLGPRARQELEITTGIFEALKPLLDDMQSKGLVSYSILTESTENIIVTDNSSALLKIKELEVGFLNKLKIAENEINKKIDSLENKISYFDTKIEELATSFQNLEPTNSSEILCERMTNLISQSKDNYSPLSGMVKSVRNSGEYIIMGEIGIHSPISPSKGKVALFKNNNELLEGTERDWFRTSENLTGIILFSQILLNENDEICIGWKTSEGVMRATFRSLILFLK